MIKRVLIIAIASAALLMGTTVYAQKPEKEPKEPRIVLEEVEVTLYENGKEIERKRITKKERLEIKKEASYKAMKRTLDKLGLKSGKEMYEKKLEGKYYEELKKWYSERKIRPPRLKVIDEKGKVLKEIPISKEKTKTKFRDERKKRDWDAEKKISKRAAVSDNKMFGAVGANVGIVPVLTDDYLEAYPRHRSLSYNAKLTVYDNKGKVLFEKQYPEGKFISGYDGEVRISDNGTVAIITSTGEGEDTLHVYDRSGKEILVYPEGESYVSISDPEISPNGKYLAVTIGEAVFFNINTGAYWKADKPYIVRELSDKGIVRAGYQNDPEKLIDLKEHLGD
jgi:hypothetical protein